MSNRKLAGGAVASLLAISLAFACTLPAGMGSQSGGARAYDTSAWKYWGGDAGQTRYAPLDQINRNTVNRLKIAWRWSADTSGGASSNSY